MDTKDILSKLPSSWKEITLKTFLKLTDLNIIAQNEDSTLIVGMQNAFNVLSNLSGQNIDDLEALPISKATPLLNKISFLFNSMPEIHEESSIKWKKFDEVTYNDFVTYQTLSKEPFQNMALIIKSFMKNDMLDEQIENLNIEDVMTGFFLQQKVVKQFLKHTKRSLIVQLMKQKITELIRFKMK